MRTDARPHEDPAAAKNLGDRLDAALVQALVSIGSADDLRSMRLMAVIGKEIPSEARGFVEAFIEQMDEAIALLEARQ